MKGNLHHLKFVLIVAITLVTKSIVAQSFVHPGAMHTNKDLDILKAKIQAGEEPWKSSYNNLKASSKASLSYTAKPFTSVECGSYNNPNIGCNEILDDPMAAYTMALRWYMEGNNQYADKAISILMAWADTYQKSEESNTRLVASAAVTWFVNAAEILRYNYSGWTSTNTNKMNSLLGKLKQHIYWDNSSGYNNWLAMGLEARLSLAVWENNRTEFDASVANWKVRIKTYIYQKSDGATPIIPPGIATSTALSKWRHNDASTDYVDGQCMETCRDFNHSKLGLISYMNAAEVAWSQGVDLFSVEKERIKDFYELHGSWMLGTKVPSNICEGSIDWKGTTSTAQEAFDLAYNHLHDRLGLNMPNTLQIIKNKRPNGAGRWCKKWETFAYANRSFTTAPPPVATIPEVTFSIKDTVVTEGYTLTLNVDAKDVDGIANVKLYIDDVLIRQETNAPYDWGHSTSPNPLELSAQPIGVHQIKAVATDAKGDVGEALVTLEVREKNVVYLSPIQDAYLQGGSTRFNSEDLRVENGNRVSYLKFDISQLPYRNFEYGQLTMDVSFDNGNGTVDIGLGTNTTWTETTLSASNTPISQKVLGSKTTTFDLETIHTFNLVAFHETADVLTLVISMQTGGNDVSFASKESNFFEGPRLKLKMSEELITGEDDEVNNSVFIYPNPSTGVFYINLDLQWEVLNMQGVSLKSGSGKEVNLIGVPKGFYFLKVNNSLHKIFFNK